jgi:cell division protein FtsL
MELVIVFLVAVILFNTYVIWYMRREINKAEELVAQLFKGLDDMKEVVQDVHHPT